MSQSHVDNLTYSKMNEFVPNSWKLQETLLRDNTEIMKLERARS